MSEKTPLERAARAMCEVVGRDPDELCVGEGKAAGQTWLGWEAMLYDARKVIGAIRDIRDPLSPVLEAGRCTTEHWRSMIDRILADE